MSREAIYALLEAEGVWPTDQRGYHILWRLAQEGLICFGAREGKQQTFALLDEWVPTTKSLGREEALAELAKRYFTSHGPATLQDFVWWSGLKVADARTGRESVASQLVQEKVGEEVYWMSAEKPAVGRGSSAVYLLPGFDEYLLGYSNRSAALDPCHAGKVCPGANGKRGRITNDAKTQGNLIGQFISEPVSWLENIEAPHPSLSPLKHSCG